MLMSLKRRRKHNKREVLEVSAALVVVRDSILTVMEPIGIRRMDRNLRGMVPTDFPISSAKGVTQPVRVPSIRARDHSKRKPSSSADKDSETAQQAKIARTNLPMKPGQAFTQRMFTSVLAIYTNR